jgi:hypothetical protein
MLKPGLEGAPAKARRSANPQGLANRRGRLLLQLAPPGDRDALVQLPHLLLLPLALPFGRFLFRPHPPHHSQIGALHGEPPGHRHVVLRPARLSSPLPRACASCAVGPDHYARSPRSPASFSCLPSWYGKVAATRFHFT